MRFDLAVDALLNGSGPLLLGVAVSHLDLDEFGLCCNLAVDVRVDLGLEARRIEALIALHVDEESCVVSAAAGAGAASSGNGVEGGVLAVKRSIRKGQVQVRLYPRRDVLGGKQVRLPVLPVLPPALAVGGGLCLLRQSCSQVGVAGGDAFGCEVLRNRRYQLQQRKTAVDALLPDFSTKAATS